MGVNFISKIIKSKFEAAKLSKSMIQSTQELPESEQAQVEQEEERGLISTKSHKSLQKYQEQENNISQI